MPTRGTAAELTVSTVRSVCPCSARAASYVCKTGRPCATQCLQQESLGLIRNVVGGEQRFALPQFRFERSVTRLASQLFQGTASVWVDAQFAHGERHVEPAAQLFAEVREPRRVRLQTMIDVDGTQGLRA